MTSVTCPLGSFKTYRIHGLIKPSKHAQRHRLYEERRRCDNINEEIQELSHLVPMHRLEDEKARRHILKNPPLSPILAARIQNDLPMCAFSNLLIYINKYGMSRGYGFVRFSDEGDQQRALQSGAGDFLASRRWLTCDRRMGIPPEEKDKGPNKRDIFLFLPRSYDLQHTIPRRLLMRSSCSTTSSQPILSTLEGSMWSAY